MHCFLGDFHDGFTPGYITPEMCKPGKDKQYRAFMDISECPFTYNATTDVYLHGLMGLELINGLPEHLQPLAFDISSDDGMLHMLKTHHKANFPALIKCINSSACKSYLRQAMHKNPEKRLTPARALAHPYLKEAAAAMELQVQQTQPAYARHASSIMTLLEEVISNKNVLFKATKQQQHYLQQQEDLVAAPVTPVRGNSSAGDCSDARSSDSNKSGLIGSLSHSLTSADAAAATTSAVEVDAIVTVIAKSTAIQNSTWVQKGLRWFKKVTGSSSSNNSSFLRAKDKSNGSSDASNTATTATAGLPMMQPDHDLKPGVDLWQEPGSDSASVKVKVPGLCGLKISFKRLGRTSPGGRNQVTMSGNPLYLIAGRTCRLPEVDPPVNLLPIYPCCSVAWECSKDGSRTTNPPLQSLTACSQQPVALLLVYIQCFDDVA